MPVIIYFAFIIAPNGWKCNASSVSYLHSSIIYIRILGGAAIAHIVDLINVVISKPNSAQIVFVLTLFHKAKVEWIVLS